MIIIPTLLVISVRFVYNESWISW